MRETTELQRQKAAAVKAYRTAIRLKHSLPQTRRSPVQFQNLKNALTALSRLESPSRLGRSSVVSPMIQIPIRAARVLDFDIENRPLSYLGQDFTTSEVTAIAASFGRKEKMHVWLLGQD